MYKLVFVYCLADRVIGFWHHTVVCPSICPSCALWLNYRPWTTSYSKSVCTSEEEVVPMNTILQLSTHTPNLFPQTPPIEPKTLVPSGK